MEHLRTLILPCSLLPTTRILLWLKMVCLRKVPGNIFGEPKCLSLSFALPETLREAGKQRFLNAIKQNQRMVSDSRIDIDRSVVFLENECYKKYGKSGKSFYLSQMASTTRWLSTADPIELMNKLSSSNPALPSENVTSIVNCTPTSSNLSVPMSASVNDEVVRDNAGSQDPIRSPASLLHGSPSAKLPPIMSFSQFINSRKAKNHASASNRESPDRGKRNLEKRMRFQ